MPDEDLTQISLGKFRVGITGLKAAIEEVKSWRGRPEEEIAQALLARVKPRNYIPASAQEEYKRAFWREFKKALGEKVEEERSGLSIKILGPGCPACERLEQTVMAVLAELGLPAEVEHVRDMKDITALGVFGTPALLINDDVKAVGNSAQPGSAEKMATGSCGAAKLSREKYAEKQGPGLFAPGFGCIIVAVNSEPGEAGWTKQKLLFAFLNFFSNNPSESQMGGSR